MSAHDDYTIFRDKMVQTAIDQGQKDVAEAIRNLDSMLGSFFSAGHAKGYLQGVSYMRSESLLDIQVKYRVLEILKEWRAAPLLEAGTFQSFLLNKLGHSI